MNNGDRYYIVDNLKKQYTTDATQIDNILFNNPFSAGYTVKYTYSGKKLFSTLLLEK